jgi:hypothetical protein
MSQRDELEFQGGAATKPEAEYGNDGGKNRDHARDGRAAAQKSNFSRSLVSLGSSSPAARITFAIGTATTELCEMLWADCRQIRSVAG